MADLRRQTLARAALIAHAPGIQASGTTITGAETLSANVQQRVVWPGVRMSAGSPDLIDG